MSAPTDVLVTSSGTTTIHSLPASNPAGTTDTVALPVQGVTGGVAVPISAASLPLPAGAMPATGGSVAISGTAAISAVSLPLPTGAGTSANQATMIASLASIDGGMPAALGQAAM